MPNVTRAAITKAAERAQILPRDHRVLMVLLSRAAPTALIADGKQPRTVADIADAAHFGWESTRLALVHLEQHGWVTRTKGKLAGGCFTRYAVLLGADCDCREPGHRDLGRRAMSDRERARRSRLRRQGVVVNAPTDGAAGMRTAVYRFFDYADTLLYVGITNDVGHRWKKHAADKPWWPSIQRQTVDWYPSRAAAELEEQSAIAAEHPRYNIAGVPCAS